MNITLKSIEPNDTLLISVQGNITSMSTEEGAANPLEGILGAGWASKTVIVDLEKVSYIDSSAIGWLINTTKHFETQGGRMILHSVHPNVQQVFDLLSIGAILTITEDESAARHHAIGA
ncbi:MAG: STAS domain-containing protein [Planctomycetota bacterium]|jgi:stage II sporulation protein AA (anti-sigma F factor antagonist)